MIIPDKKKNVTTVILSRLKKDGGGSHDMPVKNEVALNPEEDHPLTIAAQDIMQAINDKSILQLKSALKSFIDLIEPEAESEE